MKMAFVSNQQYMRGVDVTSVTVFELGEALSHGDELCDVVTGETYEVASRGFSPKRSSETVSRSHWSCEASIAFRGKCKDVERRLLFSGDVDALRCLIVEGRITDKTSMIPSGVPLVGLVTLQEYDSPAILLADEKLGYQLLVVVKQDGFALSDTLLFSCVDLKNQSLNLTLSVEDSTTATGSGPLLSWDEVDCEAAMV